MCVYIYIIYILFNCTWRKEGSAYRAMPLNINIFFEWSPPRHTIPNSLWYILRLDILPGIYFDILSGIYSDILSGIFSGIYSDILSGIYSDILSGTYFDILSRILSGIKASFASIRGRGGGEEKRMRESL